MSDQEVKKVRYARRTIEVKGLLKGDPHENPIHKMSEYGVHWNLSRKVSLEPVTVKARTTYIEGEEVPSGLTSHERKWLLDLAEKHGLEVGFIDEEREVLPNVPYIKSHILLHNPIDEEWDSEWNIHMGDTVCKITIELSRNSNTLYINIEGDSHESVSNDTVNEWVQKKIKLIRDSLIHAGYTEGELEIDCEVIMGAEREAKCDPNFMRTLLTNDEEEE